MTTRFSIRLTKSITVVIDADSEQEAVDTAINDDDINNGDWERAEHRANVTNAVACNDFEPVIEDIRDDARILAMADLFDPY